MMGFGFVPNTPTFMMEKWEKCKNHKICDKKGLLYHK